MHHILHAHPHGYTAKSGDPMLLSRLCAQTWHHAVAIAITQDCLRPPSHLDFAIAQIRHNALQYQWLTALHGLTQGEIYRPEHTAVLRKIRTWTHADLPIFTMYAGLVWAEQLPLP